MKKNHGPDIDDSADATEAIVRQDPVRKEEYARQGEFHRNLNPNWSYYPIYLNKLEVIDNILNQYQCKTGKILDAGCGEGVLVEKYAEQGWTITGVDKNYASAYVAEGSITDLPQTDQSIDTVLALDVLEHLEYKEQPQAMKELLRVVKPGGLLIFSCPNLAHFTSRLKLMFRGKLLRTASEEHHPGDRPYSEYKKLFQEVGLTIVQSYGIFPTVPPIYRFVMRYPSKSVQLLKMLRKLPFPIDWHFQIIFVCRTL
ncbi:MAG: methyltransferase domain-containing protein [Cyanobacteria bacterium P01_H01_bin.74]